MTGTSSAPLDAGAPGFPWLICFVTCTGAFAGQVDASIVQLALPRLADHFHAALDTVSWVALAYLLAFAALLPVFGRLCQMLRRKPLYLLGYALFTAASAACAYAPSISWLILFRAVQGIGGSMLGANSMAILIAAVTARQQGKAMGLFAAAQAVGISAGPVAGGLLLHFFSWQAVFLATVPFGLFGIALGWAGLRDTPAQAPSRRFDGLGAILLMPALVGLVLALNEATAWGLGSVRFLGTTGAGLVLLALFARHEQRTAAPLINPMLFTRDRFDFAALAVLLGFALLYGMFFTMSFALVRGYHLNEAAAGWRLMLVPVLLGIVAPFSGRLSAKYGTRAVALLAILLCATAIICLAAVARQRVAADGSTAMIALSGMLTLMLFGTGLGLFIAPSNHAAIRAAPETLAGEAGALLNLMRVLGTSVGVAGASATLSWRVAVVTRSPHAAFLFVGHPILAGTEANFALLLLFTLLALLLTLPRAPH